VTKTLKSHDGVADWSPQRVPLERGRVAERIVDELRDRILSGELARGAKLPTERELAQGYGVSGATVRESIRALSSMHMIEVRHGSGAYVTADAEQLLAQSLHSMIQLERIDFRDTLGVLAVLNAYGAELAATRATVQDVRELRQALDQVDTAKGAADAQAGLERFLFGLAAASHNPLLRAICKFLAGLQIGMARQIAGDSAKTWRQTTGRLKEERRRVVEAIAMGDAVAARAHALAYHRKAVEVIDALT
jgi:GntR family transcriptional regulator, transcriptional repressor for pyruvate dehydrogenase complex